MICSITKFSVIENPFYDDNNEWDLLSYSYEQSSVTDVIAQSKFNTIKMTINCRRNNGFYVITLFFPILFLTLLAPIGLILPADAGEKMGLQITVMLTVVIYIDVLQGSVPVYSTVTNTPYLMTNFIIATGLVTLCLLITTHSLFYEHIKPYEGELIFCH